MLVNPEQLIKYMEEVLEKLKNDEMDIVRYDVSFYKKHVSDIKISFDTPEEVE